VAADAGRAQPERDTQLGGGGGAALQQEPTDAVAGAAVRRAVGPAERAERRRVFHNANVT
jgi:hypothetical protein